ncbi:aminoglycoside phosphotransferase family protein [Bacillus sp. S/N-304-OC-R1]|uniref:aminoglycoside phosphotransferase family protein n=1 Tax=Bacillus sp. S/N-304-OC-R1 TaxID=2758034 RepID=UPI0021AF9DA0|nr:aminoglycoside phosphotransferase family protein [Bacillus sp. S/N-304-OC-R1]
MKINNRGDDLFHNRLFSYLQKNLPVSIEKITPIRNQVFYIKAKEMEFILKGFPTYSRLKQQEDFLSSLRHIGFTNTYSFYSLAKPSPLYFENIFYMCLEYINPSEVSFTYKNSEDRLDGLKILKHFHSVTDQLADQFQFDIPFFKQFEKWNERAAIFLNYLPNIKYFVQKEIIDELLVWADWSLKGIQEEANYFQSSNNVILHGDVAHHNFLRTKNGEIFIIDFDLISIGNPHSDYLQYANRILPFLNWSYKELEEYEILQPYLLDKGFLYGLAYPTDIFREWNRAMRDKTYFQKGKIEQLLSLTAGQFKERQEFGQLLKEKVEKRNWS